MSVRRNPRHSLVWIERALALTGALALSWVALSWLDARLFQAHAMAQLERSRVQETPPLADPPPSVAASGSPGEVTSARDAENAAAHDAPSKETPEGDERRGPAPVDQGDSESRETFEAPRQRSPEAVTEPGAGQATAPAPEGSRRPRAAADSGGTSRVVRRSTGGGGPLGLLQAPRIGLSVIVAEGVDGTTLRRAAGHLPETPRPGQHGNAAIAGHRDTHFLPLRDIRTGDELTLLTSEGTFRYEVEWIRIVEPSAMEVIAPTDHSALTLITCYPFSYLGDAPQRFIVRARQM